MRTLDAALITAQQVGYPVGGVQPAIHCVLYSNDSATSYDYSFNPTSTTNRLVHIEHREHLRDGDSAVILLRNNDRLVPEDLTGYHVDIGFGMNTSAGLDYCDALGETVPRLWVMKQSEISISNKVGTPDIYTVLELQGIVSAVLARQPIRLGVSPLFRYDVDNTIAALTDLTIYNGTTGVLKYLIETALPAQTGLPTTLAALDQDDTFISSIVPYPSVGSLIRTINSNSPEEFDTYAQIIYDYGHGLMVLTKSFLIPRANLTFKVVFPQSTDTPVKTYYTQISSGHPFYENMDAKMFATPNHIEVFGGEDVDGLPEYAGDWFSATDYSSAPTRPFTPADIETAYSGRFMPVTKTYWEKGLASDAACTNAAEELSKQIQDQLRASRIIIPMDASIEIGDYVKVEDIRGHT